MPARERLGPAASTMCAPWDVPVTCCLIKNMVSGAASAPAATVAAARDAEAAGAGPVEEIWVQCTACHKCAACSL